MPSSRTFNSILNAYYRDAMDHFFGLSCPLDPEDQEELNLLTKYKAEISPLLVKRREELLEKKKGAPVDILKEELVRRDTLIGSLPRAEAWGGAYLPVPVHYGAPHES